MRKPAFLPDLFLRKSCGKIIGTILLGGYAMSVENAIILGLVQGLTEFLPVSGSGHLSILNNLFGMSTTLDSHPLFDVLLRLAALLAVLIVYWEDIRAMCRETLGLLNLGPEAGQLRGRSPGARLFFMLVIATLPQLLILPIKKPIEALYANSFFVGTALILTGCLLYVSDRMLPGKKGVGGMTLLDALIVGLCRCVGVIPGISRSGVTITAGIAAGLRRDFAVKFAFLLSVPAALGAIIAGLVEALSEGAELANVPAYLIGMAVAMVAGIAAIQLLQLIAKRGKFGGFAYYCWVAGALSIILTMIF